MKSEGRRGALVAGVAGRSGAKERADELVR